MNSFYTEEELANLGLGAYGKNVLISRKASIYMPSLVKIGSHVRIDDFSIISGVVEIGDYVHIAAYTALFGGDEGVYIADFAGISSRTTVYALADDFSGNTLVGPTIPDMYRGVMKEKVIIDKYAVIGANCVVMPGVHIQEGACAGTMTFVHRSLEPWTIYVGVPAKRLKDRSRTLLEKKRVWDMNKEVEGCTE